MILCTDLQLVFLHFLFLSSFLPSWSCWAINRDILGGLGHLHVHHWQMLLEDSMQLFSHLIIPAHTFNKNCLKTSFSQILLPYTYSQNSTCVDSWSNSNCPLRKRFLMTFYLVNHASRKTWCSGADTTEKLCLKARFKNWLSIQLVLYQWQTFTLSSCTRSRNIYDTLQN